MTRLDRHAELSARAYNALLALYPRRFRVRFAPEMAQIFSDYCRLHAEFASSLGLIGLWAGTVKDIYFSLVREWQREIVRDDSEFDFTGFVDACCVGSVVGTLLLGWGYMGTVWAMELGTHYNVHDTAFTVEAIIIGGVFTIFTAIAVGVLSAKAVRRLRSARYIYSSLQKLPFGRITSYFQRR